MTKYFIMAMKEEAGCPSGFFYAYLVNDFQNGSYKENYGKLPWYAGPKKFGGTLPPFPRDLSLVVEDQSYAYDIRRGSVHFYIISDKLATILPSFKTSLVELAPVAYLNRSGETIQGKKYYAAKTRRISKKEIVDYKASKVAGEFGEMFETIKFKDNINLDLFDMFDTSPNQFSLIASEHLKSAMENEGIKGVTFIDIETVKLNSQEDIERGSMKYTPV
ncbi:imm11 family protein [Chromobacterium sp. LK1]|uniref:Imm43 family immunity protein n=1 Tax=Chromobacterium sp. LK1 TaxID=1628193 RepID=UPI000B08A56B|nr:DUF1629 domain-containing protein [Chromobacterium sp. LK1]